MSKDTIFTCLNKQGYSQTFIAKSMNRSIKPQQFKLSYFERVKLNKKIGVKIMSKKRTKYTSAFKTKLVLEVLQNESTLVQIASKYNILPQNLQNWKKATFN